MAKLKGVLAANREAVDTLLAAAENAESVFTTPRAPGKWSPSQVVEHVARTLDESARMVTGEQVRFPRVPALFRPVVRRVFFNRVVRTGSFPKAKTRKPFDPESGPATPAAARTRLNEAFGRFREACQTDAPVDGKVRSETFGAVPLADYVRFVAAHTRHHTKQIPVD